MTVSYAPVVDWVNSAPDGEAPDDEPSEILGRHPVVRTSDLAEASEVVERLITRSPMRLAVDGDDGTLGLRINAVELGTLTAGVMSFGVPVRIDVAETRHYYVNLAVRGRVEWHGDRTSARTHRGVGTVLGPTQDGVARFSKDAVQVCLVVARSSLERELEQYLDREPGRPVQFDPVMDLAAPSVRGWLEALSLVHRELDRPDGLLAHPLGARTAENLVLDGLLLAQPHNYSELLRAEAARAGRSAVHEAIDLMEAEPGRPWSVGELARAVHLSARALQDGFARTVEMSPMQYLRRVRMSRARDELVLSTPDETTVGDVAARWGFLHHGRFAAAYRARFGETPARTLRSGGPAIRPRD